VHYDVDRHRGSMALYQPTSISTVNY